LSSNEPQQIEATALLKAWDQFDSLIDARSPAEWQADHLPAAINLPVLSNEERAQVGTLYQASAFEAKKLGAALVAQNISRHLLTELKDKPRHWQPLIYCWRGGNRSHAFATILQRIGFKTTLLVGGYTAFRRALITDLEQLAVQFHYHVVCGVTGSGKSHYLRRLQAEGAQVLDLEALAHHRGSLLGSEPVGEQPSQKFFETQIWHALRQFDSTKPVYVESESRKIGQVQVPGALIERMRESVCIELHSTMDDRIEFLCQEYEHFFDHPAALIDRLERLRPLVGGALLDEWVRLISERRWPDLVRSLLVTHYDPTYLKSMQRNYRRYNEAEHRPYCASDFARRSG
jgi:tRNA 2-selenouridine synthase